MEPFIFTQFNSTGHEFANANENFTFSQKINALKIK